MKKQQIRKLVLCALLAALCFAVTRHVMIPAFYTKGYINIGDSVVLLSAYVLGGPYGIAAAAVGSALADLSLGYLIYMPATFIIKGLMAFVAGMFYKRSFEAKGAAAYINIAVGSVIAEILMVAGYFAYELVLYGLGAVTSVIGNLVQGAASAVIAIFVISVFRSNKTLVKLTGELRNKK